MLEGSKDKMMRGKREAGRLLFADYNSKNNQIVLKVELNNLGKKVIESGGAYLTADIKIKKKKDGK